MYWYRILSIFLYIDNRNSWASLFWAAPSLKNKEPSPFISLGLREPPRTVKLSNFSWLARTDPADVARVESKTFISTANKRDTVPTPRGGAKGVLGNWWSPEDMEKAFADRFPGCMNGERKSRSKYFVSLQRNYCRIIFSGILRYLFEFPRQELFHLESFQKFIEVIFLVQKFAPQQVLSIFLKNFPTIPPFS